jgi:hypothetical protein
MMYQRHKRGNVADTPDEALAASKENVVDTHDNVPATSDVADTPDDAPAPSERECGIHQMMYQWHLRENEADTTDDVAAALQRERCRHTR